MTNLRLHSLSRTGISDAGIASIAACVRLEDLGISDTASTDESLDAIQDLPNLSTLYVERTRVSTRRVAALKASARLVFLYSGSADAD